MEESYSSFQPPEESFQIILFGEMDKVQTVVFPLMESSSQIHS